MIFSYKVVTLGYRKTFFILLFHLTKEIEKLVLVNLTMALWEIQEEPNNSELFS